MHRKQICWGLIFFLFIAIVAAEVNAQGNKPVSKSEVGYVVSVNDGALVLSNIPTGSSAPAPQPGKQSFTFTRDRSGATSMNAGQVNLGPGDIVEHSDGTRSLSEAAKKRLSPQERKQAEGMLAQMGKGGPGKNMVFSPTDGGGGNSSSSQVQLGPGDTIQNPDGTLSLSPAAKKRMTPDQQRIAEEALKNSRQMSGGGAAFTQAPPQKSAGGNAATPPPGKSSQPLQLSQFVLDGKTRKPSPLGAGEKVRVTFTEQDGKKVATRIEKAK